MLLVEFQTVRSLYVNRSLLNADAFIRWATAQGFHDLVDPDALHVTIALSKTPVEWSRFKPVYNRLIVRGGKHQVKRLGDVIVLCFVSPRLHDRWRVFCRGGASWDFASYQPHVTISYVPQELPAGISVFNDELIFGPEQFDVVEQISPNHSSS